MREVCFRIANQQLARHLVISTKQKVELARYETVTFGR